MIGTPASVHGPRILDYLGARRTEFVDFIRYLAAAESPSNVPESQAEVRSRIASAFEELGFVTKLVPGFRSGGKLYARPAKRLRRMPAQLMLGHYDTVWPLGTLESMPLVADDNVVRGPGVYDMKGGIAQMVFALKALRELDLVPGVTPLLFVNSDEEIGSGDSHSYIRMIARRVIRVFVLEPSLGVDGKLKTARKGIGRFTVTVKGKAAHAGLDPEAGVSAILELSHVIQVLFALNDAEKGITVNVGTVDGGLRPNVIAPQSKAVVDVRVRTRQDAEYVENAIRNLTPTTPGTELSVSGYIGRPALEKTPRNRALWALASDLGRHIGLTLNEGAAGGGSDGNTTSQFTATLDGLGPVGDGAHAHHEFLYVDKTLERTALLALLLLSPPLEHESGS